MYSTHASFPRCPASFPATIFRPQYLFLHICNKAKTPTSICATNPMDVEWLDEVQCNMASLFWTWIASMMLQMWDDCNLNVINVYFFLFFGILFCCYSFLELGSMNKYVYKKQQNTTERKKIDQDIGLNSQQLRGACSVGDLWPATLGK